MEQDGNAPDGECQPTPPAVMPAHPPGRQLEASVARCLRTPPGAAKRQDFKIGLSSCLTQPEQPEHSCRWQLLLRPDNGGTMPSKSAPFTPSSILFRPRQSSGTALGFGGGAGYCPRVR